MGAWQGLSCFGKGPSKISKGHHMAHTEMVTLTRNGDITTSKCSPAEQEAQNKY